MKRTFVILLSLSLIFLLLGCSTESTSKSDSKTLERVEEARESGQSLVVYYSKTGNTRVVAETIFELTESDIVQIEPETPYPESYDETLEIAQQEQKENARPGIVADIPDIDQYDIIYLGYPCWWGTMPQLMFTFLDEYDLSGKIIAPFDTNGGSGLGSSVEDIKKQVPSALVLDGLAIRDDEISDCGVAVESWLERNGLIN